MRQIELLKLGENVLKKENIQDSHIKASILLQYVLNQTKQELIINSEEIVEPSKVNKYNNYLQEIIEGTPIQYITKHQQFMALDFYVDENVLIPQPDTEVLVEEGIKIIKEQNAAGLMDARFCPCGFDAHPILCAVLRGERAAAFSSFSTM